ncbi:MAG TPA: carbohydrate-binding domain-containing protein [Firmicutes bacterium]|nr:carbohydrate-binding domain-containing protein [Bacillota bacterium]
MKKGFSIVLVLALLLGVFTGCGDTGLTGTNSNPESSVSSGQSSGVSELTEPIQADSEMFTDRDYKTAYDESNSVRIQLNGDTATASSNSVRISGSTIMITEEATYIISGVLDNGMIIVDAPDTAKLQLVLDGASITSATSAPLYIREADKVFVTLADNSENTLSNGGSFEAIDDENIDAALYSKQDLTLNGSGSLAVISPAGHGIASNDDLVITGGTYSVTSASHGLNANDSVRITGETSLTVDAGKDGVHAENNDDASLGFVYIASGTINIEAEGDGVSAGAYMQIQDGAFQILTGGGSENGSNQSSDSWGRFRGGRNPGQSVESITTTDDSSTSMKGLKSTGNLTITGGSFTVDSADDSIHSNASLSINGGTFTIASGDDAFHAEETLTVTAGTINITESYEGLEALDVDIQGGDITLVSSDDGLNAAGGTDSSGTTGGRDAMFGNGSGRKGGGPGGGMSSSSNGSITISEGTLYINASGDGIDANGSLTISGGYTVVVGPTQGDTATLDYDTSAVITGGTFIGTGAANMAQTFSDSEQGVISIRVENQSAGTEITLTDQNGNVLISYTPELSFNVVILSSPDIVSGQTYSITAGNISSEIKAS